MHFYFEEHWFVFHFAQHHLEWDELERVVHCLCNAETEIEELVSLKINWQLYLTHYFLLIQFIDSPSHWKTHRDLLWVSWREHSHFCVQIFVEIANEGVVVMWMLAIIFDEVDNADAIPEFSVVRFEWEFEDFIFGGVVFDIDELVCFLGYGLESEDCAIGIKFFRLKKRESMDVAVNFNFLGKDLVLLALWVYFEDGVEFAQAQLVDFSRHCQLPFEGRFSYLHQHALRKHDAELAVFLQAGQHHIDFLCWWAHYAQVVSILKQALLTLTFGVSNGKFKLVKCWWRFLAFNIDHECLLDVQVFYVECGVCVLVHIYFLDIENWGLLLRGWLGEDKCCY